MIHPFKNLKRFAPRSLYGRFVLILLMPLLLGQIILGYFFIDRHTDTILEGLATSIAGDMEMVIEMIERGENFEHIQKLAQRHLNLTISYEPNKILEETGQHSDAWLYSYMGDALREQLRYPFFLHMNNQQIYVDVQLPETDSSPPAKLQFVTLRKRLFARTTGLVLVWSIGAAIILFFVSFLFLRNQMRSLTRLAHAAEEFGKGNDASFQAEGALEIRKVGIAFSIMRHRIQRLLNERMEMLAGISHDLRTPIARLKLQTALMKNNSKVDQSEIDGLNEDVKQMEEIVEGFLSFSHAASSEISQSVNVYKLIEDLIKNLNLKPLTVHLTGDKNTKCDFKLFLVKRCLTNIMLNSKKYAKILWIHIKLLNNSLEIVFEDDGPGIPVSERENVFKPFYRLDTARNLDSGGVGLGLSISRDVMRTHGGSIEIEESDKGGISVHLIFPC